MLLKIINLVNLPDVEVLDVPEILFIFGKPVVEVTDTVAVP
jgi:hypothetical protein